MTRNFKRGFTLLELMVVVAIVAILSTLAYSSYMDAVRKSNRGDAQSALVGLASAMQRFYTEQAPSTYVGTAASGPPGAPKSTIFPSQSPIDGSNKYYNLIIQSTSASAFAVRAVPISGGLQASDECGTLTLTSTGQRGITGGSAGTTWDDCWR